MHGDHNYYMCVVTQVVAKCQVYSSSILVRPVRIMLYFQHFFYYAMHASILFKSPYYAFRFPYYVLRGFTYYAQILNKK